MLERLKRFRPARWVAEQRWLLFDVALAVLLVIASLEQYGEEGVSGWWWLGALPLAAALVIRRRRPVLAVALAVGSGLLRHLDPAVQLDYLDLAVPLTIYTLASTGRSRRTAAIALAAALLGVAGLSALQVVTGARHAAAEASLRAGEASTEDTYRELEKSGKLFVLSPEDIAAIQAKQTQPPPTMNDMLSDTVGQALGLMLVLGLAFAIGDGVRSRRAHLAALVQRAADLEREQHQRVALATAAERARISRELHDVVAHGLSVIVVQAQGAAAALERHPDRAAEALQNVIATGRDSLADMRRLLDLVRRDPTDDPALSPSLGVGALPELIDRIRAAGTRVSLVIDGEPAPLPASVDLSAYRIVQEALTNTIKHAGAGANVVVRLAFQPERLEIEVVDDGTGGSPADAGAGTGLHGIEDRVAMHGGEWSAGPAPTQGFRVWAALPLDPPVLPAEPA